MENLTEAERKRRYDRDQRVRRAREAEMKTADPEAFAAYRAERNAKSAQWRKDNPEKVERIRRKAVPGRRVTARRYRENNREFLRTYARAVYRLRKRNNPAFNLVLKFDSARARAKKKGIPFDLTPDDIVIPERCPILGIPLIWKTRTGKGERDFAPALDRVKNDVGYVKGNVRVISTRANRWKADMTLDDARKIVAYMELHNIT